MEKIGMTINVSTKTLLSNMQTVAQITKVTFEAAKELGLVNDEHDVMMDGIMSLQGLESLSEGFKCAALEVKFNLIDGVTISISEDYLVDAMELYVKIAGRLAKPICSLIKAVVDSEMDVDHFTAKWFKAAEEPAEASPEAPKSFEEGDRVFFICDGKVVGGTVYCKVAAFYSVKNDDQDRANSHIRPRDLYLTEEAAMAAMAN